MKKILTLVFSCGLLIGCSNDDSVKSEDFLVFGHFYGMCEGEGCVETFKLTETELLEDVNDDYLGSDLNFQKLENEKFEKVKDLMDYFPNELLSENETILGCPDCADGGGLFIQYYRDGSVKSWRIDQVKRNVPNYLHEFIDEVNHKIMLINN